ncbi:hypothetical protein [Streptomyces sp. NPDC059256]|uniref:hypothetical protein n=1 Tax=Streptomyces sp. NPDC059256 TaxID=3346794 RepID=UPI003674588B
MRRPLIAVPVLTALALTLIPTASATTPYRGANTKSVQDDFNGDGYRDLAIGASGAANGTVTGAGAVVVLYGSATSVGTARRSVITQASAGIPGTAERGDGFGSAVASADLDRDGYADLLVGTPQEAVSTRTASGSLTVVWGGPGGLKGGADITPPTGFGNGDTYCAFGVNLATGDTNGDGAPEVSVASLCEGSSYTGPFTRAGKPRSSTRLAVPGGVRGVVMGDVNRDGKAERFWLPGSVAGDLRGPVYLDGFGPTAGVLTRLPHADGHTGQVGDVNGDGFGDLITGIPDDGYLEGQSGAAHRGGEIQVLHGSARGIATTQRPKVFHQDTAGVPGTAEHTDFFGEALSVADINGDRYADVIVGSSSEAVGTLPSAGSVAILRGSARGLTTVKAVGYTQNTVGLPGASERYDFFGSTVHLADLNRDGRAETVVGIPGENADGCVWIARGTPSGPAVGGSVNLCGRQVGLTVHSVDAQFGIAMPSGHITS